MTPQVRLFARPLLFALRLAVELWARVYWEHDNGTDHLRSSGALTLPTGQWHHVAITRNSASKQVVFYLNGPVLDTLAYVSAPTGGELSRLFVCGNPSPPEILSNYGLDGRSTRCVSRAT